MMIPSRLTLILIIILLLMGGALTVFIGKWQYERDQKNALIDYAAQADLKTEKYLNKYNQEVARNKAVTMSNKTLRELISEGDSSYAYLRDELRGVRKSLKNLESATLINSESIANFQGKASDTVVVFEGEEMTAKAILQEDEFNKITGIMYPDFTYDLTVKTEVPLQGAVFWTRKWFLGRKTYQVDFTSDNPNVTITGLQNIRVQKK